MQSHRPLQKGAKEWKNMISSEHNAPRDALVEYSVRRLLLIIAKERKKHEKRKELCAE